MDRAPWADIRWIPRAPCVRDCRMARRACLRRPVRRARPWRRPRAGRQTRRPGAVSDAALRDGVEVRLVEDDLAEVPEDVRLGRLRRMVVVEAEQRALAVTDLEEAHDPALVGGVSAGRLAALQAG